MSRGSVNGSVLPEARSSARLARALINGCTHKRRAALGGQLPGHPPPVTGRLDRGSYPANPTSAGSAEICRSTTFLPMRPGTTALPHASTRCLHDPVVGTPRGLKASKCLSAAREQRTADAELRRPPADLLHQRQSHPHDRATCRTAYAQEGQGSLGPEQKVPPRHRRWNCPQRPVMPATSGAAWLHPN
jgi:hypothetical protein